MRRLALILALLALPVASAVEAYVVLLDWQEGRALAPTTPFVTTPLADSFLFDVDACHPNLLLDLLYDPAELAIDVPDVGAVAIAYEFRVEVWHEGERILESRVRHPGYGVVGTVAEPGEHEVRLSLGWGADVNWSMRMRGKLAFDDPACNPPP